MFHRNLQSLTMSYLAIVLSLGAVSESSQAQEPAFKSKPATGSLPEAYKRLADSLEHYGTPIPYLRHVLSEHERVQVKYRRKMGKSGPSAVPDWLTEEHIAKMERSWAKLSPSLELDAFAKRTGKRINAALSEREGFVVEMLNAHQAQTFEMMTGNGKRGHFSGLKREFLARLDSSSAIDHAVAVETGLSVEMAKLYRELLSLQRFRKSDFGKIDRFYGDKQGRDALSKLGQDRVSRRVAAGLRDSKLSGQLSEDRKRFQATLESANLIEEDLHLILRAVRSGLPAKDAAMIEKWLNSMMSEAAEAAHAELMVGILEWALDKN
ncbi:MAG: hypothetical protein KDN22_03005 [Verrucomicrobiae bacterium]|nr:hypothetical protein [Verrucomicrobiae bacterium]